ncbi:MAG TPA: DMT family transporter [Caldimonas sp.]|jgi:drug/metabolite transporter (DMT)-like permease|nr:DMT family transporter [Caldimonas sp.]HEX2541560.1 DMT family transporter [Caldimonas sp.]
MPWLFVVIWATGFVVARLAMPHSPPFSFLLVRFGLSAICFAVWIAVVHAAWPQGRVQWGHLLVTGAFMQAGYLGGVWAAIRDGLGAGTVALLVGLQPVLTALWISRGAASADAPGLSKRRWLGLVLGFAGLALVVWGKLGIGEVTARNLAMATVALFSITIGTLYQKRFVAPCDVRSASAVQMLAGIVVCLPFALLEPGVMRWHPDLAIAMAWSVGALTLGGSSLLYLLIQRGEATAVTSLLYLVPPCTALMAWALFGESFTPLMMLGMALTVAGVALVVRAPRPLTAKETPP